MNTEEIMAMAREAGLLPDNSHPTPETRAMRKRCEVVKRFAALVAAKERNDCALICENMFQTQRPYQVYAEAAQECAAAIRARGTKEGV